MESDVPYTAVHLTEEAAFYMKAYEYHFTGQESLLVDGKAGQNHGNEVAARATSAILDGQIPGMTEKEAGDADDSSFDKPFSADNLSKRDCRTTVNQNEFDSSDPEQAAVSDDRHGSLPTTTTTSRRSKFIDVVTAYRRLRNALVANPAEISDGRCDKKFDDLNRLEEIKKIASKVKKTPNLSTAKLQQKKEAIDKGDFATKSITMATNEKAGYLDRPQVTNQQARGHFESKTHPRHKHVAKKKMSENKFKSGDALVVIGSRQHPSVTKATIQPFERKSSPHTSLVLSDPFAVKLFDEMKQPGRRQRIDGPISSTPSPSVCLAPCGIGNDRRVVGVNDEFGVHFSMMLDNKSYKDCGKRSSNEETKRFGRKIKQATHKVIHLVMFVSRLSLVRIALLGRLPPSRVSKYRMGVAEAVGRKPKSLNPEDRRLSSRTQMILKRTVRKSKICGQLHANNTIATPRRVCRETLGGKGEKRLIWSRSRKGR
ncbi:uncharacterized protein [Ptychodera flava]|uniref:uncharacterized protein n=1 Tax=Ptychodera flava TaxID=63121 RepID=UPI00396AA3DA